MQDEATSRIALLLALTGLTITACAAPGTAERARLANVDRVNAERQLQGRVMDSEQAARLIGAARTLAATEGCDEAIPVYRVLAAYGRSFEVAQYELGQCLLDGSPTPLDRREAMIWIERAAFAGHREAQKELAEIAFTGGDYATALGWALVFNDQNDTSIAPMQDFSAPFMDRLQAGLGATEIAAAERFAEDFSPDYMASFRMGRPEPQREDAPDDGVKRIR
ncbi:hypothetical protein GCM10011342_29660 [Aquisalinus flavus]|uniref:Sel1 repeat family protein n=1 Tax=Aquisalinus flavus TaxID=1526572 RepID=A0A8J2Y4F4_9PROT|nr:SEL1-like repeat protein [Aquisalinus flavus]MBD0428053.1 SEL1-like repeat protein [Aquisalinus flavus]GGD19027.1 hypothetical protein GCM10011342_29660 [Aquisalinus flavus]